MSCETRDKSEERGFTVHVTFTISFLFRFRFRSFGFTPSPASSLLRPGPAVLPSVPMLHVPCGSRGYSHRAPDTAIVDLGGDIPIIHHFNGNARVVQRSQPLNTQVHIL